MHKKKTYILVKSCHLVADYRVGLKSGSLALLREDNTYIISSLCFVASARTTPTARLLSLQTVNATDGVVFHWHMLERFSSFMIFWNVPIPAH